MVQDKFLSRQWTIMGHPFGTVYSSSPVTSMAQFAIAVPT